MIFLLCAIIECMVAGVTSLAGLYILRNFDAMNAQAMMETLQIVSANMNLALEDVSHMTYKILGDSILQQELSKIRGSLNEQEILSSYHILYNRLIQFQNEYRYQGILDLDILTHSFDVSTRYMQKNPVDGPLRDEMIRKAAQADGKMVLCASREKDEWLAVRSIRQIMPFDLEIIGTMVIHINPNQLVRRVTEHTGNNSLLYWVLDQNGEVFFYSEKMSENSIAVISEHLDQAPCMISMANGHFFLIHGGLNYDDWGYSLLLSCESQWQARKMAYTVLFLTMLFSMAATALTGCAFVRSIDKRTNALLVKIENYQSDSTACPPVLPSRHHRNEIDILHDHFDAMAQRIDGLIQEKYISELLSKDAQLRALESQINPHFLYNVLQSINSRAQLAHNTEITSIVEALGRFLRISLDSRTKVLSLREELNLVHDYMIIQKERFEEQLSYTENVPDAFLSVEVPKMILQPLVENAVKYALENGFEDTCTIAVQACRTEGTIHLSVENSGSSFPEDMLGKLHASRTQKHGFGIGLKNIHERLQLSYGENYGIWLSNQNGWAVCEIRIPDVCEPVEE